MKLFTNKKILISFLAALILLGLGWRTANVRAGQPAEDGSKLVPLSSGLTSPVDAAANPSPARLTNANCIMCHQYTKFRGVTEDALQVSLTVDVGIFSQSVHGKAGILCVSCHTTFTTYPHSDVEQVTCEECHEKKITVVAKLPHENRRIMQIQFNETCRNCHANEYSANSIHTAIAQSGQVNTPLCTDCHGGHDVQHPTDPPERVTLICSNCHTAVYSDFLSNAHNSADPLKQTCATCHIPHEIQAAAAAPVETPLPTPIIETTNQTYLSLWNSTCTMCHTYPNLVGKAKDSTTVSLTVTDEELSESVHGKAGLGCAACHQSITGYPHQDTEQVACSRCHGSSDPEGEILANLPFESRRDVSIQMNEACRTCHEDEYKDSADSMHTKSLEEGNLKAPLCVDCHGSHSIKSPKGSRLGISQSCAKCHESVYSSYQSSVHGVAIEKSDSPDAPTCADCHGVHLVTGPRQANFRSQSVLTCTRCHQDPGMMSKYGVSAELFNPNVDNFHGVALGLFNQQGSDLASKTAVCYDCHGIHTIRKSGDPLSSVNSANLLETCQKCHPDASNRFASVGSAHNKPAGGGLSLQNWIERIYTLLIIAALALLVIYILLDGRKRRAEKKEFLQPTITGK
jgi:hypothetical protein